MFWTQKWNIYYPYCKCFQVKSASSLKLKGNQNGDIGVEVLQIACFLFQTFIPTNKTKFVIKVSCGAIF